MTESAWHKIRLPFGIRNAAEAHAAAKALAAQAWACGEADFELIFKPSIWIGEAVWVRAVTEQEYLSHQAAIKKRIQIIKKVNFLFSLIILLGWGGLIWTDHKQHSAERHKLAQVQEKIQSATAQAKERQAWLDADVEKLKLLKPRLELDLNPVFDAIESIDLPQVRLKSLDIDTNTRAVQLGYELGNMSQFQALNDVLTREKVGIRCKLTGGQTLTQAVEGQWRCDF